MNFITEQFSQTLEIKQSKFIAHLTPYEDYEKLLHSLKNEHPKARHFVTAFRYLNEYNQIVEHSSDDGEPKGTSGKPSLMVLQGSDVINTAVIIIRYFGGTKLGTGGLVRAYSDAVNLVISNATFFEYKKEKEVKVFVLYTNTRMVEYECEMCEITVVDKIFGDGVTYILKTSEENMQLFINKIQRLGKILE
ncbi:YigZ family protein [bacterium]|nr:YigZ family protein [bacterium]